MPQHRNAQSFIPRDPRAIAAGRLGGKKRKLEAFSPDYALGYAAGARNSKRHIDRWTQEHLMELLAKSAFLQHALRLHGDQRAASTPDARTAADEALAHFLRMSHMGRFDEWLASHHDVVDDEDLQF